MSHLYAASALLLLSLPHGFASSVAQELPAFQLLSSDRPVRAAPTGNVVAMVGVPLRPRPALVSSLENKLASYLAKPTRGSAGNPSTLVGAPFAFAPLAASVVPSELSSDVFSITSTTTSTTTSTISPSSLADETFDAIQYKSIGSIATEVAPLAAATPPIFVDPLLPTPTEVPSAILSDGVVADIATPLPITPVATSNISLSSLNASVAAIPSVIESAVELSTALESATALPLAALNESIVAISSVVESATALPLDQSASPLPPVVESVTVISTVVETVFAVPSAVESVVSLLSVVESDIPVVSVVESATSLPSSVGSDVPLPPALESAFPEVPVEEVLGPKAGALELTDFVSLVQKIADVISGFFHVLPPTADTPANILAPPPSEFEAPTDGLLLDDEDDVASKAKRDQQYPSVPLVTMASLLETLRNLTATVAGSVPQTNSTVSKLPLDTVSDALSGLGKRDTLTAEQQSLVTIAAAKVAELQLVTDALKALAKSQLTKREQLPVDAANLYPTILSLVNTILTAFGIPTGTVVNDLAVDPVVALSSALDSIKGKLSAGSEKRQVDPNAYKDLLSRFIAILENLIQVTKNVSGTSPITPATPFAGGPFSALSGLNGKLPVDPPAFVGTGGPFAGTGGPFAGTGGPFAGAGGPLTGQPPFVASGPFASLPGLNGNNPTAPPFVTGGPLIAGPLAAIAALADKTPVDIASILAAPLSAASSATNVASVLSAPLASASSIVVTLPDLPISSGSIGARGGSLRARQALILLSSLQDLPNSASPAAGGAGAPPLNALQNLGNPAQAIASTLPLNGVQNLANPAQAIAGPLPIGNVLPLTSPAQSGSSVAGPVAGLASGANPVTDALNGGPDPGAFNPVPALPISQGLPPLPSLPAPLPTLPIGQGLPPPLPVLPIGQGLPPLPSPPAPLPTLPIGQGLPPPLPVLPIGQGLPPLPSLPAPLPTLPIGQGLPPLPSLPAPLPALPSALGLSPLAPVPPFSLPPGGSLPLSGPLPKLPLGSAPLPVSPVVPPITPGIGSLPPAPLAVTPTFPSVQNVAAPLAAAAPVLNATTTAKSIVVSVVDPLEKLLNTLKNLFGIHTARVKRDVSVSAFPALNQDENHARLRQGGVQSIPNNAAHAIKAPAQRMSTRRHEELTRYSQAPLEKRQIVQETDIRNFIDEWHAFSVSLAEISPGIVNELVQVFLDPSGSPLTPDTLGKYPEALRAFILEFYGFSQLLNDAGISVEEKITILRALFLGLSKRNMRHGARLVVPTPDNGSLLDDMSELGEDAQEQTFGSAGTLDPLDMLQPAYRRSYLPEPAPDSLAGGVDQAAPSTGDLSESDPASGEYADDVATEYADASSV
jgi:hypothetical protein